MTGKTIELNINEQKAQEEFLSGLKIEKRNTDQPIVIAMVGLVGSGKTSVANELSKQIEATVIQGDEIRIHLRKKGESYDNTRTITENTILEIINKGGNVVLDSDCIGKEKQESLKEKLKETGANLVFVRVHCNIDVMLGRAINAEYQDSKEDFFGGASSKWEGGNRGAVVKIREMVRRMPHHYEWVNEVGGKWELKPLDNIFAEIDTTKENWQDQIQEITKKL